MTAVMESLSSHKNASLRVNTSLKYDTGVSKFGGRELFLISATLPGSASISDALSVPSGSPAGPSTGSAPCGGRQARLLQ